MTSGRVRFKSLFRSCAVGTRLGKLVDLNFIQTRRVVVCETKGEEFSLFEVVWDHSFIIAGQDPLFTRSEGVHDRG